MSSTEKELVEMSSIESNEEQRKNAPSDGIVTNVSFASLGLSDATLKAMNILQSTKKIEVLVS